MTEVANIGDRNKRSLKKVRAASVRLANLIAGVHSLSGPVFVTIKNGWRATGASLGRTSASEAQLFYNRKIGYGVGIKRLVAQAPLDGAINDQLNLVPAYNAVRTE
jgi:hypothetical protein